MTKRFGDLVGDILDGTAPVPATAQTLDGLDLIQALAFRYNVSADELMEALRGDRLLARIGRDLLKLGESDLEMNTTSRRRGRPPSHATLARQLLSYATAQREQQPSIRRAEILRRFYRTVMQPDAENPLYSTYKGIPEAAATGRLRQTLIDAEARFATLASLFEEWPTLPGKTKAIS